MLQKRMFITQSMQRLLNLFEQIEDEDIRNIIAETVFLESKHRSSSQKNFPIREVRNLVDTVARLREGRQG
jgi:hypothetical protein